MKSLKEKILLLAKVGCVIITLAIAITACSDDGNSSTKNGDELQEGSLVGTKWQLTAFVDIEKNTRREPDYGNAIKDSVYLLSFDNDSLMSGRSFSNSLFGVYRFIDDKISMQMGGTEICEYGDGALYSSTFYKVEDFAIAYTYPAQLDLFYENGKKSMRFYQIEN